jgi:hypothetical protein
VAPATNSTSGFNFSSFVMSPANDKALVLSAVNSQFGGGIGTNTTAAFVGIPGLSRGNILGASGWTPLLTYSPSIASSGIAPSTSASPTQFLGDLNINQLWEYGIHASSLLYSDTAFAALPNATTLYAGQILAPPSYWNGANGKRYALDVVYQSGTTGTPNGGATTCSGSSGTSVLTCTSATDLSTGQQITVGTDTSKTINYVDATHPGAVLVNLTSNLGATHSSQALAFSAPLLASEIQMPTKSSSAPTSLAWSQGDMEENSGATANGIAAWVNVSAGAPGTWAGIPLGNSSGQISASQISSGSLQGTDAKILTAGTVTGAGITLCTDANGGATTSGCQAVSGVVAIANGGTGASSASAALANLGAVATSTTVNGHALSGNVTVSASDLTSGTLPHAQLPALVSADIPNNAANITGTAVSLSAASALPNGTTATTQSANDNSTKLATTAYVQNQARNINTPDWLQYLGNGADGSNTNASGALAGEKYYTNFTIPYGNTVTVQETNPTGSLVIHATGTCTIAGTILANGANQVGVFNGVAGGASGGSGGGVAAGTAGRTSYPSIATSGSLYTPGGSAGAASGGNGGNASASLVNSRAIVNSGNNLLDGIGLTGATGAQGANSGGALGYPGAGVTLICAAITGTDGTHTGIIDVSGGYGTPPSANSTGAGSGGGGGVVILSSQSAVSTWPAIYAAGGPGGLVTVPEALATSGTCTSQPKVTLGVTSGALSSCTVAQAGAGCGTGTNITWNILGGGGTGGAITPTWSGGALASCTASGGSGYTATTYTTAGTGGDGGAGWFAEFQGW